MIEGERRLALPVERVPQSDPAGLRGVADLVPGLAQQPGQRTGLPVDRKFAGEHEQVGERRIQIRNRRVELFDALARLLPALLPADRRGVLLGRRIGLDSVGPVQAVAQQVAL